MSPIDPKRLSRLVNPVQQQAPLPEPWGVLYAPPSPDGNRKSCSNCVMYATADRECYIHDSTLDIDPQAICGYWVYGLPMERFPYRLPMVPVDPGLSGLE